MIKYIGSKRLLVDRIVNVASAFPNNRSFIDLFSGTSRVGFGCKAQGFQVFANDITTYAATVARCYVEADAGPLEQEATTWIKKLNALPGVPGYVTETFCKEARFFRPENGARIDAMRQAIADARLEPQLEAILLTSLIEAADRVDSTTGVQMAYLKEWAKRAYNPIALRLPTLLPAPVHGPCRALQMDAYDAAKILSADIAYLDPPYNQHKYYSNYHIWETIVRGDTPESYGVARKRIDCKEHQSPFNSKPRIQQAMHELVDALDVRYLIVSFNNEGYIPPADIVEILARRGQVWREQIHYKRYVGAQIGIHNHKGKRVGNVSHLHNKENLFVVLPADATYKPDGMVREA